MADALNTGPTADLPTQRPRTHEKHVRTPRSTFGLN